MSTNLRGGNDAPIKHSDDDHLGFKVYVDALCRFILSCETPMTVAIQGDWGSGKTSLMNLIRATLSPDNGDGRVRCAWINTWQFSQFDLGAELPFSVIALFSRQLAGDQPAAAILRSVRELAMRAGKGAALMATAFVAGKDSAEALANYSTGSGVDATERIGEMRGNLQKLIDDARAKQNVERFVVFVDDIDRLVPERAVELLEAMKVFLDIEGCVFVLACDYQVVSSGLRAKFAHNNSDLKGKHFFDKIIQLPFSMPSAQLDISNYLQQRLKACGIELLSDDRGELSRYEGLLAASVGFNPRSLKRLANCLHILRLVAQERGVLTGTEEQGDRGERERALFAALCLQTAFEPMYLALIDIASAGLEPVMKAINQLSAASAGPTDSTPNAKGSTTDVRLVRALTECESERHGATAALSAFAGALQRALQIKSGKSLELESHEVAMFVSMLRFSSITATSGAVQEVRSRIDFTVAGNVLRPLQTALRGVTNQTSVAEEQGFRVAPIIAGLGFQPWFGFDKRGALIISLDIKSDSEALKEKARVNARTWAHAFFSKVPNLANRVQTKKANATYGAVLIQLEPDGFACLPEAELHSKVSEHANTVYIPLVKFLIKCQTEFRSKGKQ